MRYARTRRQAVTAGGAIFVLGWILSVPALKAQTAAAKPASARGDGQDTNSPIQVQSNLVTAPVTVTDLSGQIVYGLHESDFRVYDNGALQQITRFDNEEHPVAAVILVQNNDAVAPLVKHLDFLVPVITQMLLGPKGRAAVVLFDDQIKRAQGFTNSSALLEKTLKDIPADSGKARLNDAMMQAINMLDQRPKGDRRIILAISNGADSGSETSRREVVERAAAGQVTIYGLSLSGLKALLKRKPEPPPPNPIDTNVARPPVPGMPNTPDMDTRIWENPVPGGAILGELDRAAVSHSKILKSDLAFYTRFTGGALYSQWSSKALVQHLARLADELHTQYELAYVPNDLSQSGFHRIEIRVERPGVQVRSPEGYFYYQGGTR
jgi:VWFA-related protein